MCLGVRVFIPRGRGGVQQFKCFLCQHANRLNGDVNFAQLEWQWSSCGNMQPCPPPAVTERGRNVTVEKTYLCTCTGYVTNVKRWLKTFTVPVKLSPLDLWKLPGGGNHGSRMAFLLSFALRDVSGHLQQGEITTSVWNTLTIFSSAHWGNI